MLHQRGLTRTVVRKDHTEQVCIGQPIKSGSFLWEGAALVVGGWCGSRLNEPLYAVGQVVTSDVFGVDVQLAEEDFGHSPLHGVAVVSVEASPYGED